MRYEVVESRCWRNTRTGRTASIYGALPFLPHEEHEWRVESRGFTLRDNVDGTVGCGRPAFQRREDAQELADRWNQRILANELSRRARLGE